MKLLNKEQGVTRNYDNFIRPTPQLNGREKNNKDKNTQIETISVFKNPIYWQYK